MTVRKTRKTFIDDFSPAEHAYTGWLARNGTTLLSHSSAASRDGSRYSNEEPALAVNQRSPIEPIDRPEYGPSTDFSAIFDEFDKNVLPSLGDMPSPQSASLHRQATGLAPRSGPKQSVASTLLMDGMEDDARPGGAAPPAGRPEPPREVHPPLRETSRPPECEWLATHIRSLQGSRSLRIRDRERALAASYADHKKLSELAGVVQQKRERLSALEYQLRVLDQMWPPSTPRRPNPGYPGPVPDIVDLAFRNELRRQAATLRREIQHIENHMNFLGNKMLRTGREIQQIEGKLREVEMQLIEPERQYRLKCGELDPRLQEWQ